MVLQNFITTSKSGQAGSRGAERRRSRRAPYIIEACLYTPGCDDDDPGVQVVSLDLSRHGVGFALEQPLPAGAVYLLEMGYGDERISCLTQVIRCEQLEDGTYRVGAEFLQES